MRKLLIMSVFATVPFAADAADLYGDYNFIQEPAPSYGWVTVGHLELSGGWEQVDFEGEDHDLGRFEGRGRVNIPFAGNWNLELETGGVALFQDGNSAGSIGVYGHLWGGWSGFRIGAFGGIDFLNFGEAGTAGLEAEIDVGDITLGVLGHYSQQLDCGSCYLWGVMGWVDAYIAANTRLGIDGRWTESQGGQTSWSVGATAEQRFAGTPVSLFVRGNYEELDDGGPETLYVIGGLRIFMDGGLTLQEHDQQVPFQYRNPEFLNVFNFAGGPP